MNFAPQKFEAKDDEEIAAEIAAAASSNAHTQAKLLVFAKNHGLTAEEVGPALKQAGFTEFDPARWKEMQEAIIAYRVPEKVEA